MDIDKLLYIKTINKSNNNKNDREAFVESMSQEFDSNYSNVIDQFEVEINTSRATQVVRNLDINDKIPVILTLENAKTSTESKYYAKIQCYCGELETGDYISFVDKESNREQTLIIVSIPEHQHNYDKHDIVYALNCNQTINRKGFPYPIPCSADNSSYGVKGEIEVGSFSISDGKMKVHMQRNKLTDLFMQNERVLFDHDRYSVYEIVDISSVTTPSLRRLIMNKVEYKEGYDDLEKNIAWNKFDDEVIEKNSFKILSSTGKFEVMKNSVVTFSIKGEILDTSIEWNITVNTDNIGSDWVEVLETTKDSITIKNLKGYNKNTFDINYTHPNGEIVSQGVKVVNY